VSVAVPGSGGPRLLLPTLLALAAFIVLVALGTWQIERRTWKHALIAELADRLAAPPVPLPKPADWPNLRRDEVEFRRVVFKATFAGNQEAYVYTVGSTLRADAHGPGYWVFAPVRLADGNVVVNRGFVPEGKRDPNTRAQGPASIDLVGVIRWPETPGMFQPPDDVAHDIFFGRDQRAMAAAKGWGPVAPFYVEQEAPPAPEGFPQVGRLQPNLPDNHLQYALTWYGLAAVLVGVFAFWARGRKDPRAPG
jgi:surfeit locus 1 family protein